MKKSKYFSKITIPILSLILLLPPLWAQQKRAVYQFKVDITAVKNDKLFVELTTPQLKTKKVLYHLPKVVPGTYAIHNYGAFVSNFQAFDHKGKSITVKQLDKNTWEITKADKLAKINYYVDDTWSSPENKEDIFEAAGTEFEINKFFVLNNFGLFGYFKGMEKLPYEIRITKPKSFYGATALVDFDKSAGKDLFKLENYHRLADSPILYSRPDTTWLHISNTEVLIAVYSPNRKIKSHTIAKAISPILEVQKKYLGGILPVDKYAYLFFLSDDPTKKRYGALEHSYSSFYFLPEAMPKVELIDGIKHAAAHEFFHIVTPLNIHSEEIGDFDYINPKMSKHLWFYEGLTEYASLHAQIKGGLMPIKDFLPEIANKIQAMKRMYNDSLPFTEMSKFVLDKYKNQYLNVYQKGALIAMCLDIKLRLLSNGDYGTQDLVKKLSEKYGKNNSFNDDNFFDEITAMTYPEIREFFSRYVEGGEPLPIDELLESMGMAYDKPKKEMKIRFYKSLFFNFQSKRGTFQSPDGKAIELSKLGKSLGFLPSDELISINGIDITMDNIEEAAVQIRNSVNPGDLVEVVVSRVQTDNSRKNVILSTKVFKEEVILKGWDIYHYDTHKIKLRNAWLGIKSE